MLSIDEINDELYDELENESRLHVASNRAAGLHPAHVHAECYRLAGPLVNVLQDGNNVITAKMHPHGNGRKWFSIK